MQEPRCSAQSNSSQDSAQNFTRFEVFFRDLPCRVCMKSVVRVDLADRFKDVFAGAKVEKALPAGQIGTERGVLSNHRPAGCEIASASIAKPAARGGHIAALGDTEFCFGRLNEAAVLVWCACHPLRLQEMPAVLV